MNASSSIRPAWTPPAQTVATVREVRPLLGLAYLEDDDGHEWTVTRSTAGLDLARVAPGQRLAVKIEVFGLSAFVREGRPAD